MKSTLIDLLPNAFQQYGDKHGTAAELCKAQALLSAAIEGMEEDSLLGFFAGERHTYAEFDNLHLSGAYLKRLTFVALSELHQAHGEKLGIESQIKRVVKCIEIAIQQMTDAEFTAFLALPELAEIQTAPVALQTAAKMYAEEIQPLAEVDERVTEVVLSPYRKFLQEITPAKLTEFFHENAFIKDFILRRSAGEKLFANPAILLVFFLAENEGDDLWYNWPLDRSILEDVFSLLGISTSRY